MQMDLQMVMSWPVSSWSCSGPPCKGHASWRSCRPRLRRSRSRRTSSAPYCTWSPPHLALTRFVTVKSSTLYSSSAAASRRIFAKPHFWNCFLCRFTHLFQGVSWVVQLLALFCKMSQIFRNAGNVCRSLLGFREKRWIREVHIILSKSNVSSPNCGK